MQSVCSAALADKNRINRFDKKKIDGRKIKKKKYNEVPKNVYIYIYIYISGAETGLVLLVPGTTNNSVNVIQNGLKIIH